MSEATVTVTCWGCNKSETHPMKHGEEDEEQQAEFASRGWMRRAFGPSSWDLGPWFCSSECAHESFNAKRAEEWWEQKEERERQVEFQKYCRETTIPKLHLFFIFGVVGVVIAIILKEVINVTIQ